MEHGQSGQTGPAVVQEQRHATDSVSPITIWVAQGRTQRPHIAMAQAQRQENVSITTGFVEEVSV